MANLNTSLDGGRPVSLNAHHDGSDAWSMASAAPADPLARFVSGYTDYWERTGSFTTRREIPSLQAVLIVNLGAPIGITGGDGAHVTLGPGEGFVGGLHDRHALSHSAGRQTGIHVWLTMPGFQRLLGGAAGAIANRTVKLADLLGRDGLELGDRLLEAPDREGRFAVLDRALGGWLAAGAAPRPEIVWAFAQLRGDPARRVADLAARIGWSRKTLNAHFQDRYGMAPKTVSRLARFERAVACAGAAAPDWSAIAQDCGYFDQSHLIRDFSEFAGLTPTAYHRRLRPGAGLIES
jgi:AraC-like DNA-binding protein